MAHGKWKVRRGRLESVRTQQAFNIDGTFAASLTSRESRSAADGRVF
jgi:hypothetical protein